MDDIVNVNDNTSDSDNSFMDEALADISKDVFGEDYQADSSSEGIEDAEEVIEDKSSEGDTDGQLESKAGDTSKEAEGIRIEGIERAPNTWKQETAQKWETIDPEIRQEIIRRESEFHSGIEQYKSAANLGNSFHDVAKGYLEDMNTRGIPPLQMVAGFFELERILATGTNEQKLDTFAKIARDYGIDFSGNGDYVIQDETIQELRGKIQRLESNQAKYQETTAQSERARIQNEIDTFSKDPVNKYFNEVQNDMAALITGGKATGLKDAYEQAIWLNPKTRQMELDRIATEREKTAEDVRKAQVTKAKNLKSVNVSSSKNGVVKGKTNKGNWEEDLSSAYDSIVNRH